MLFNSLAYLIFFSLIYCVYWFLLSKDIPKRNLFLLCISYFFYGWWDYRFLLLIILSSSLDFVLGQKMAETEQPKARKRYLWMSLGFNLGMLGFFKYFNFFIDSFASLLTLVGLTANYSSLQIILPVGISFYTFQTLSYTLDIYKGDLKPTKNIVDFFAFVSFFPQLVAGPIERAKNLLPQFTQVKIFDSKQSKNALRLILWGLFQKIAIADTCAQHADFIFANYQSLQSGDLIAGALFFTFQIYGDFCGYSNIAIGSAKMLGFDLMKNFNMPYFSKSIGEFWKNWHISLSTWFRDYVYIPLGGSRGSKLNQSRNIIITFTVSGFWHGANWTFLFWGLLNGLYYLPSIYFGKKGKETRKNIIIDYITAGWKMGLTFALTVFAWIFFRAPSITVAVDYIARICTERLFLPTIGKDDAVLWVLIMLGCEWFTRTKNFPLENLSFPKPIRWSIYLLFIFIIFKTYTIEKTFIYFQF